MQARPRSVAAGEAVTVSVRVLRRGAGRRWQGVRGAEVTLSGRIARTGPHGLARIRFSSAWAGRFVVVARKHGFRSIRVIITVSDAAARPASSVGFWAGEQFTQGTGFDTTSYWAPRNLSYYTPRLWSVLARYHVPIYLNLRYQRDFGPAPAGGRLNDDALVIIRRANQLGVPVWAWMLVPPSHGYWAQQNTAAEQLAATKALAAWSKANHVLLQGLAYDPELPMTLSNAVYGTLGGNPVDSIGLAPTFREYVDPGAQCEDIRAYNRVYAWARSHFDRVIAAPQPFALDDIQNGDIAEQNAIDAWGLPRGAQALYFQAYRSIYAALYGFDPGSAWVAYYMQQAQGHFGATRGQVTIGIPGDGPYQQPGPLVQDIELAKALGADAIPIYSLEDAVTAYGDRGVQQLVVAGQHKLNPADTRAAAAPTPNSTAALAAANQLDTAATAATPVLTASKGNPQLPNKYPGGCDGAE